MDPGVAKDAEFGAVVRSRPRLESRQVALSWAKAPARAHAPALPARGPA
jgi:hypothetical protein